MSYFEKTRVTNADGTAINPGTEESNILLRRIVKLLEQQAAVDAQQRQRITLDAITAGVTLPTVTAVTGVGTVASVTGVTTVGNINTLAGLDQRLYTDWARAAYNTGIRRNLTFT